MAFIPELDKAKDLYLSFGRELFALCYLHTGGPKGANALLNTLLCDLATSPRRWHLAQKGKEGLFRCAHSLCLDQYYTRPKRKKKKKGDSEAPRPTLPFIKTDALRALLALPPKYKTPLYLRLAMGWSAGETASVVGGLPARVDWLVRRGLKKAKLTEERAGQALSLIAPMPGGPEEQWDLFLIDREDRTFTGQQRLRRFKRWMDHAIPYIALGVIAFCVLAYQGVEHGWFSGEAYVPTLPEGVPTSQVEPEFGTVTVFGVDTEGIVQYDVTNCPKDPETLVRQMVALGGAPEGTYLLSAHRSMNTSVTLELSKEAAQADEQMRIVMGATFATAYPDVGKIHIISAGQELNMPDQKIDPVRTVTTPYHE